MNGTLNRIATRTPYIMGNDTEDIQVVTPDVQLADRLLRLRTSQWDRTAGGQTNYYEVTAVVPTRLVNRILSEYISDDIINQTVSATMPHSATKVICYRKYFGPSDEDSEQIDEVHFVQTDGISLGSLGKASDLARQVKTRGQRGAFYLSHLGPNYYDQYFDPVWLTSPDKNSQSSIVVFFSALRMNESELKSLDSILSESNYGVEVITCSLSAFWITSQGSITRTAMRSLLVTQTLPIPELDLHGVTNITLNTTGVEMLYSPELTARMSGQNESSTGLAAAFALTISDIPSIDGVIGESFSMPELRDYGNIKEYSTFELYQIWYAYGYCANTASIRLSLAVIMAYCIITVVYLAYILATGLTSTAWNSAIELVALALQSRKPDHLGGVAVGIESIGTLNEGIGIRVNNDDELELVFANDRNIGLRNLKKVKENMVY